MNKLKATLLVGIAGSLPIFASAPAQAATACSPVYTYAQITAPGFECFAGDKTYYMFNLPKASNNINYFTNALFVINAPIAETHTFQVTSLNAAVTPTQVTPITLTYSYKVKIDPMGAKFEAFSSDATINKQSMSSPVASDFVGSLKGTPIVPPGPAIGTATYMPGMPATPVMVTPPFNGEMLFEGSITLKKNALLTQFTDTLSQTVVPGPLPVVGAAAAFGFSRKLRKRVKAMA